MILEALKEAREKNLLIDIYMIGVNLTNIRIIKIKYPCARFCYAIKNNDDKLGFGVLDIRKVSCVDFLEDNDLIDNKILKLKEDIKNDSKFSRHI